MSNTLKGPANTPVVLGTTDTVVYTVPGSTKSTVSVIFTNTLGQQVSFRLHHSTDGSSSKSNALYYDAILEKNQVLTLSGLVMEAGHTLRGLASIANAISVKAYGIETT